MQHAFDLVMVCWVFVLTIQNRKLNNYIDRLDSCLSRHFNDHITCHPASPTYTVRPDDPNAESLWSELKELSND